MCIMSYAPAATGELDPVGGYEIQTAEEGKQLTNEQRESNWALGGQTFQQAFGEDAKVGKDKNQVNQQLGNLILRDRRNKLRSAHPTPSASAGPIAPSAPPPSTPGRSSLVDREDEGSVNKNKLKARKISKTKRGTKNLGATSSRPKQDISSQSLSLPEISNTGITI